MSFTAVIDYGMGNLLSVTKALAAAGAEVRIVGTPAEAENASVLVLPGVGGFGDGMRHLNASGFVPFVKNWIAGNRPFLGICLGMQMLFDESEEAPGVPGLGVIRGKVVRFPAGHEKVPQIGWNQIVRDNASHTEFFSSNPEWFYFVHSYYVRPEEPGVSAAVCEYILPFTAAVAKGNLLATQFHPEKSQSAGLALLRSFFLKTQEHGDNK